MNVGNNIRRLRRNCDLTQADLGNRLGVSDKTVSSWEINRTEPNMGQVQRMAEILNCKISDIIEERKVLTPVAQFSIPVLGRVQAGIPIDAIEEIIGYEEITQNQAETGEFFALMVQGDSMEPKFSAGDVVIVRKQCDIDSGQIGIVIVDGTDATVKRIVKHDEGGISLIALNPSYPPKFYTNNEIANMPITIVGRVVELRAKF